MINNETLFDSFVGSRRAGARSSWQRSRWQAPLQPAVSHVQPRSTHDEDKRTLTTLSEPQELLSEVDIIDPVIERDAHIVECANCHNQGMAMDLVWQHYGHDYLCFTCDGEAKAEYDDYVSCARGY